MTTKLPAAHAAASDTTATIAPARLAQIRKTAQSFEAIFIRQVLDAAAKTHFDADEAADQGMDSFRSLANARLADLAAAKGSFGIAGLVERQLLARERDSATPVPAAGPTTGER
ncbi:MAG: flagellar biosynthesis protein FlgJ [Sphingomonadales bacterium]|nr:flagellar biosynthesis protein FlgJ [Sphingomonadales bacterium]